MSAQLVPVPCVYLHATKKNQVFYIGMSKDDQKRPYSFGTARSAKWNKIMKRLCGSEENIVVTVIPMPTIDAAFAQEKLMIETMQPIANTQLKQTKETPMNLDLTFNGLTNGFGYNAETGYINLSLVIDAANAVRKLKSLSPMRQSQVFKSKRFTESLDMITRDVRKGHYDMFPVHPCATDVLLAAEDTAYEYQCLLPLAVEVAAMMSVKVQRQALRAQVQCMTSEAPSVDYYPALTTLIRDGLCISRGQSIEQISDTVASMIDSRLLTRKQLESDTWGGDTITSQQALRKMAIEAKLVDYIHNGLIVTSERLYSVANTIALV